MIRTQNCRLLNAVLKILWNNKSVKSRWPAAIVIAACDNGARCLLKVAAISFVRRPSNKRVVMRVAPQAACRYALINPRNAITLHDSSIAIISRYVRSIPTTNFASVSTQCISVYRNRYSR